MDLLYISTFMFHKDKNTIFALPSCADSFFQKYLDVFEKVHVLGEELKSYLDLSALIPMEDNRISVDILPANTKPQDFKNDKIVKYQLTNAIRNAEAVLIKPATRRGMMAIKICERLNKPYMIEMTGDIHNALRQHPNILKRMYAPVLYSQIKYAIRNCQFGLYVSKEYLQQEFPIPGKMCGCSDVVLRNFSDSILEQRMERINTIQTRNRIDLALIGFYQGKMKGVDTAIRALSHLDDSYHLNILGNGTEENRKKWIEYGEKLGVKGRIHFPKPLPGSEQVCQWLDTMDAFVFPTRSEGFGRCVAEAMARGCPCFATNICSMPELLPAECLFPLNDDVALANQVSSIMEDENLHKNYAKLNFIHAQNYEFKKLKLRRNEFLSEFKKYCINYNN